MSHTPDNAAESLDESAPEVVEEAVSVAVRGSPHELRPWEEQFARWLAFQSGRVDFGLQQSVAQRLAGKNLARSVIRRLRSNVAWRRAYEVARAELYDVRLKAAHGHAIALLTKGMLTYKKAVNALDRELTPDENGKILDPLGAIRAAAPLLGPLLDRALPKKHESNTVATSISITLTPEQMVRLDAPQSVISGEEIIVEPESVE
jgi:hypothetical protein